MKKLKYILCFVLVLVGLLFSNFTFADTFNFGYKYSCVSEVDSYMNVFHCSPDFVWCTDGRSYNSDALTFYVYSNSSLSSVAGCSSLSLLLNGSITITCNNGYLACSESFVSSNNGNSNGGYFHGNVLSSANGANLVFSDTALAEGIGKPIFTRGANLINLLIKFFPIMLLIAFFGIFLSALHNVGKIKKEKKDKSLENK